MEHPSIWTPEQRAQHQRTSLTRRINQIARDRNIRPPINPVDNSINWVEAERLINDIERLVEDHPIPAPQPGPGQGVFAI